MGPVYFAAVMLFIIVMAFVCNAEPQESRCTVEVKKRDTQGNQAAKFELLGSQKDLCRNPAMTQDADTLRSLAAQLQSASADLLVQAADKEKQALEEWMGEPEDSA